jgi:hypothetical protein
MINFLFFNCNSCFSIVYNLVGEIYGKVTFRTTFSFRTPVAVICYDLRTEEKRQGVRKGVRNGKIKKVHGVRNEEDQEFVMTNRGRSE